MARPFKSYAPDLVLLTPSLILLGVFVVVPIAGVVGIGFTRWPLLGTPEFTGFANFLRMARDPVFWITLRNTLIYALVLVPTITFLSLFLAVLLNRDFKGSGTFKAIYVVPLIAGIVVTSNIWKGILGTFGPVNELLAGAGVERIGFFGAELAVTSIALTLVWRNVGYYCLFFLAGLKSISREIFDSAAVDGCTAFQTFRHITMPLMRHVTFLVVILTTIGSFQVFSAVYILTGGGPANASLSLLNYIYDNGWKFFRMGYASSLAVVFFVVLLALSLIQRRFLGRER